MKSEVSGCHFVSFVLPYRVRNMFRTTKRRRCKAANLRTITVALRLILYPKTAPVSLGSSISLKLPIPAQFRSKYIRTGSVCVEWHLHTPIQMKMKLCVRPNQPFHFPGYQVLRSLMKRARASSHKTGEAQVSMTSSYDSSLQPSPPLPDRMKTLRRAV